MKFGCRPLFKTTACRSPDLIYHPNCNAKCLIEYLSDGNLSFQIELVLFLIYTILIALYCLLYVNSVFKANRKYINRKKKKKENVTLVYNPNTQMYVKGIRCRNP